MEAPDVLEAVRQPVGGRGIAARLQLPEPNQKTRHAVIGRLFDFERILEVAPKSGRGPFGNARFDAALRVH